MSEEAPRPTGAGVFLTTGVRLSVCERGWRSSFVGVGLSMEESPKDCVQRGALEAVVRRRPLIAAALGQGWLGASTSVAAVATLAPWQLMLR